MRILYLNPGANLGGAETSLVELLAGIRSLHPEWQLHMISGGDGPLIEEVERLGVSTTVLPLPDRFAAVGDSGLLHGQNPFRVLTRLGHSAWDAHCYGLQLARQVTGWKPDIVHATGLKMQILAGAYVSSKTRLLWHIHDYVSWRPLAGKLLRLLAGKCRGALVNSHSVAADLRACCPGLKWIETVYNAVDECSLSAGAPLDLDALSGLEPAPPDTVRLGLVATFARWKGHEVFLDALAGLSTDLPWRAYIIGGPIYQTDGSQYSLEELKGLIEKKGLTGRVGLTGFLRDRGAAMRALDVVVHATTKQEPFGMVVIEGMICGRPVIVSSAGGAAELFEEGITGLGHQPGDVNGLRAKMKAMIQSRELRERLGRAGQIHARGEFSRQNLSRHLTRIYSKLIEETVH